MSRYVKFHYNAGYVGTDTDEIFVFDDNVAEDEISSKYEAWIEEQHVWDSYFEEVTYENAKKNRRTWS